MIKVSFYHTLDYIERVLCFNQKLRSDFFEKIVYGIWKSKLSEKLKQMGLKL